jgi:histone H3/H4
MAAALQCAVVLVLFSVVVENVDIVNIDYFFKVIFAYFDEVKNNPATQPNYWLGAVLINSKDLSQVETEINNLSFECFGSVLLTKETEFHASDIFSRRANFKTWNDYKKRIDVLMRLAYIAGDTRQVNRFYVRMDCTAMIAPHKSSSMAFMYLLELIDEYLKEINEDAVLIGDRDNDQVTKASSVALSRYRNHETDYFYGKKIERFVDTVYFGESHLSRLIQLADAYVWLLQFCKQRTTTDRYYPLVERIRNETQLLMPNRAKSWPTPYSWIQRQSNVIF